MNAVRVADCFVGQGDARVVVDKVFFHDIEFKALVQAVAKEANAPVEDYGTSLAAPRHEFVGCLFEGYLFNHRGCADSCTVLAVSNQFVLFLWFVEKASLSPQPKGRRRVVKVVRQLSACIVQRAGGRSVRKVVAAALCKAGRFTVPCGSISTSTESLGYMLHAVGVKELCRAVDDHRPGESLWI